MNEQQTTLRVRDLPTRALPCGLAACVLAAVMLACCAGVVGRVVSLGS